MINQITQLNNSIRFCNNLLEQYEQHNSLETFLNERSIKPLLNEWVNDADMSRVFAEIKKAAQVLRDFKSLFDGTDFDLAKETVISNYVKGLLEILEDITSIYGKKDLDRGFTDFAFSIIAATSLVTERIKQLVMTGSRAVAILKKMESVLTNMPNEEPLKNLQDKNAEKIRNSVVKVIQKGLKPPRWRFFKTLKAKMGDGSEIMQKLESISSDPEGLATSFANVFLGSTAEDINTSAAKVASDWGVLGKKVEQVKDAVASAASKLKSKKDAPDEDEEEQIQHPKSGEKYKVRLPDSNEETVVQFEKFKDKDDASKSIVTIDGKEKEIPSNLINADAWVKDANAKDGDTPDKSSSSDEAKPKPKPGEVWEYQKRSGASGEVTIMGTTNENGEVPVRDGRTPFSLRPSKLLKRLRTAEQNKPTGTSSNEEEKERLRRNAKPATFPQAPKDASRVKTLSQGVEREGNLLDEVLLSSTPDPQNLDELAAYRMLKMAGLV